MAQENTKEAKKRVDKPTPLVYTIDTNKGREERKMFKTWEKIVAEHEELGKMMTEKHELLNNRVREWNSKRAPLMREEEALREKLLTCTERERKGLETKIDAIVDELKPLNEKLDSIIKKEREIENRIYKYMRENLTEKELKKARKHGWEI